MAPSRRSSARTGTPCWPAPDSGGWPTPPASASTRPGIRSSGWWQATSCTWSATTPAATPGSSPPTSRSTASAPGNHPGYLRQLLTEPEFTGLLDTHATGGRAGRFSLALGGEAFDAGLWDTVAAHPGVQAWNLYGPTEATVDTVLARVDTGEPVLGEPTAGTRLYVLDARLQHTLPGAAGELYIAGRQLARGYRGRPELTAERFVADPFAGGGERMYRTGDVVYRHADGRLVFAGRNDDQLKIRGFRVEPGEVEQALRSAPGVSAAVVRSIGVTGGNDSGLRLIGYIVPAAADQGRTPVRTRIRPDRDIDDSILSDAVRNHVRGLLPDYMVPAAVVVMRKCR